MTDEELYNYWFEVGRKDFLTNRICYSNGMNINFYQGKENYVKNDQSVIMMRAWRAGWKDASPIKWRAEKIVDKRGNEVGDKFIVISGKLSTESEADKYELFENYYDAVYMFICFLVIGNYHTEKYDHLTNQLLIIDEREF